MKGITYFTATGKIDGIVSAMSTAELEKQSREDAGIGVLEIQSEPENLFTGYFVSDGALTSKQHFTIENIPIPAVAIIEGEEYPINELPVVFEFDTPGYYTVVVDAGEAYHVEEFTIDYQP